MSVTDNSPKPDPSQTQMATPVDKAVSAVLVELQSAMSRFGPFASPHEGYAVILEELDELWHEVKHGTRGRQRDECIQVAAMAVRYLVDLCTPQEAARVAVSVREPEKPLDPKGGHPGQRTGYNVGGEVRPAQDGSGAGESS